MKKEIEYELEHHMLKKKDIRYGPDKLQRVEEINGEKNGRIMGNFETDLRVERQMKVREIDINCQTTFKHNPYV